MIMEVTRKASREELIKRIERLEKEIEQQAKEIERKDRIKQEIKDLKSIDLTIVYMDGFYDGKKKIEDKIKAKIEELEQDEDFYREQDRIYEYEGKLNLLQSLLEEE